MALLAEKKTLQDEDECIGEICDDEGIEGQDEEVYSEVEEGEEGEEDYDNWMDYDNWIWKYLSY